MGVACVICGKLQEFLLAMQIGHSTAKAKCQMQWPKDAPLVGHDDSLSLPIAQTEAGRERNGQRAPLMVSSDGPVT